MANKRRNNDMAFASISLARFNKEELEKIVGSVRPKFQSGVRAMFESGDSIVSLRLPKEYLFEDRSPFSSADAWKRLYYPLLLVLSAFYRKETCAPFKSIKNEADVLEGICAFIPLWLLEGSVLFDKAISTLSEMLVDSEFEVTYTPQKLEELLWPKNIASIGANGEDLRESQITIADYLRYYKNKIDEIVIGGIIYTPNQVESTKELWEFCRQALYIVKSVPLDRDIRNLGHCIVEIPELATSWTKTGVKDAQNRQLQKCDNLQKLEFYKARLEQQEQ